MSRQRTVLRGKKDGLLKIDAIDRQILQILQKNGRATTSEIARTVGGITKVAVAYRIRRLLAQGVIEGFMAKVDGTLMGQDYVLITRLVCAAKGERERDQAEKIARIPGVQSVYGLFGPFDLLVIARAKDRQAARDLVYQIYQTGEIEQSDTTIPHTVVKESTEINALAQ